MTAAAADRSPAPTGPEPVDRRRRRTARTRAGIEAAALRLFTEQGFEATTVEQIAEAADIAPRTFFRHFPGKDAVLFGDLAHETERMREVLAARPADEHPMRSLAAALLDAAERIEPDREQHLMRARLLESSEAPGHYEFHMLHRRGIGAVVELLTELRGPRTGADPRLATWTIVLISCFGSAMRAWLQREDGTTLRELLGEMLADTTAGLGEAAEVVRGRG